MSFGETLGAPRRTEDGGEPVALRRALGLGLLVLYGLGTIIGAGIYVLVGEVVAAAGMAAPLAFLLAGLLAALTGLTYAELAARFPEAAGAAAYVGEGLGSALLSRLVGFAVLFVGIVLAASLARGAVGYLAAFVAVPAPIAAGGFVLLFTAVACLGVRESVGVASLITLIELAGLVLVIAVGWPGIGAAADRLPELIPASLPDWLGIGSGAFLAFFAFIGFETLANMGEEAREAERTVPRAILLCIVISTVLYVMVSATAVLAVPAAELAASAAPLALVMEGAGWAWPRVMAIIVLLAVPGGILIDMVMSSRLLYGMARRRLVPSWLGRVTRRTRIPLAATLAAGAATFALAVAVPFAGLVAATSSLTLLVFLVVNLSLWRLHRQGARPAHRGFRAPRWAPPLAVLLCLVLMVAEIAGRLAG